jgi:antitoxin HigA-1
MPHEPIMPPSHPGAILREEFLDPLGLSVEQLAAAIGVPEAEVSAITRGERAISAGTGLRLARYFGMSERFFTGLQKHYERELARDRSRSTQGG